MEHTIISCVLEAAVPNTRCSFVICLLVGIEAAVVLDRPDVAIESYTLMSSYPQQSYIFP